MGVSFKNQTVTVIRAGVIVERGTQYPDWSSVTTHTVPGCRVQPLDTSEVMRTEGTNRDAVVARWRFFGPAGADVTALDRISHDAVVYEVDGEVQRWSSPTGGLDHVEAILRKVDG